MHAILTLHEKIRTGEVLRRREGATPPAAGSDGWTPEVPVTVRLGTPT